jgi:hypothetical protein
MANYVLPQVLVFQDLTTQPAVAANPLCAHISGGHAQLVRYAQSTEKEFGDLGLYDDTTDNNYLWPNRAAGGIVDEDYTKLYIENALLKYFSDPLSAGSDVSVLAGDKNRIRSASVSFASNGAYARDPDLYDRNVAVGDVIRVRGVPTGPETLGEPVTLWTYVRQLIADEVAASINPASVATSNADTQSCAHTISQTAGAINCVTASVNGCTYDGTPAGKVNETYTIKVLDSSVGGDHTTARLLVLSASGTDDQSNVIPSANGVPTPIGSRGLTVTFSDADTAACSLSADNDNVSPDDLIAGQEFTATVTQAFTATTAISDGSYSSTEDTTYIVTVTKGGSFASLPEISVTTASGTDQSGPHVVTGTGVEINIGTRGVTIEFGASTKLNKGDRFYVPVTGIGSGPIRTIVLGHNLDETFATGDEVGIDLYIRKPVLEVSADRTGMAPLTNWEQSATEITVKSGIVAYDPTWTDSGVALPLSVYSSSEMSYGNMYVEYRAWLPTLANQINGLSNVGDIDQISGALTPDNPLKWGVFQGLSNSNGTPVLYTAVTDPSNLDAWSDVLEVALTRDDIHGLVPLTRDASVLSVYQAHANNASSPTEGQWRTGWFNLAGIPEIPVVSAGSDVSGYRDATTSDGENALAVFEDDPSTTGSQYTICRVPAANADFVKNGVRAGDIVRALYVGDGFGNFSYSEFVVDSVQSENQLRVVTGPDAPQGIPAKIEIWRSLSLSEEASAVAKVAGAYGDRRIKAVWPDKIEGSGLVQEGYFLCCALAGLASAVLPQQGLTNVQITGFSAVPRTSRFNKLQLDTMAAAGTWIVAQNRDGEIYTRHAVTTGDYEDINQREEMITRNLDSISYRVKDYFSPWIGVTNVTPSMRDIILGGADKLLRSLKTERTTPQLGGQLVDGTITRFFISETFKDRYVIYTSLLLPYATNNIEQHLVI